jgi:hypothetical protein
MAELPGRLEATDEAGDTLHMEVRSVALAPPEGAYRRLEIRTSRGTVACRYYPRAEATHGAVWVGGVGGGFDTPAQNLYPRLCRELTAQGIASLRVRFRHPTILAEAVLDVLAGLAFLQSQGISKAALTGGRADRVLPALCSQDVYERAGEPKRLLLFDHADHGLDEVAGQVRDETDTWIVERLEGRKPP